jgi:hypothetical protein
MASSQAESRQVAYGSLQSAEERRKHSKTSTARSDVSSAEERSLIIRRTLSNVTRSTPFKEHIELQEIHSIHSFNVEKIMEREEVV